MMTDTTDDRVSRRRYDRECQARKEAEALLEQKSRALFKANDELSQNAARLEQAVQERTAELSLALERAEAASTARSRFIATMSHEIRTPLGGLLGMIDLLSMDEVDPGKQELLDYANTAGTGLSRIVNDVLDFSKMEAGVFLFEQENVDIRALIESIRILLATHEHGTNRRILARIDDSVPKLFLGDATRMRQIISNLVNNALRYSTDGPIIVRAGAKAHPDGVLLRVEVEDFGVGIAEENIDNLFKDFTQIANPLTAAAQGTGLGLAICKRIVLGMGGVISVDSRLNDGSTFWFEVPVQPVSNPDAQGSNGSKAAHGLPPEGIVGRRVLLAEDNLINQKLLLTYLDRMGLHVDLAENGRIALEKFAPGKYDLVLMDVAMPEMDGLEATRRIRDKWSDAQIPPMLALTAHVMDAVEEEAKLVGIDRILSKPIPYEDLKLAIEIEIAAASGKNAPTSAPVASVRPDAPEPTPETGTEARTFFDLMAPTAAESLLDIFGHDGLIDFAGKFITDSNSRIEQLLAAERSGDVKTVTDQAHSLKGAALALGFADLAEWARRIEHGETHLDKWTVAETAANFQARLDYLDKVLKN
ncbi:ATP-binding protein [Pseudooceanicola algae]|uniref:histidine kinase n=1 Tax=Pseudooceanicola algae TaxID=1537215 RepID=A0A418SCP7_9RHOB|nr:ATP-binding protein [Pseudooceanicola algae]QPM92260.1 Aerobic respiration control sensor protein ArcB [Pseudooceanicola algae]